MSKEKNTKQMSLLGDSHANHSQLQEKEKEQMTIDTSGMKLLESSENANRNILLAKMLKVLLTSKTAWYSDRCKMIWKKKVSKSNVLLFQLQASVLGIKEKESGLSDVMYPTPTSQDHSRNTVPPSIGKTRGMDLSMRVVADQMRMYPTPSASCQMDVVAPPETVKQNSSGWSVTRVGTGTKFGAKLNDVVNKIYNTDKNQIPTPTAHDSKNVTFPISQKGKSTVVGNMLKNDIPKPGGKLNPTFVEVLMGFPENWTKIEQAESKVSETQSSHKWQESSDSQSKKFYRTPTAMDKGDNSFKYAAKILKGKLNRSQSKQPVQKTLSMDVAMEHLKNNQHLIDAYDEKFKMRPHLPPKETFIKYLKENLDKKKLVEDSIIKKTTIDHWLRSDHCFAYPTVEYWNMIKPYLKEIKFDYQMTFEIESDWE